MIIKEEDCNFRVIEQFKDGSGEFHLQHVVGAEELMGHGRLYAKGTLPPGASVGKHEHKGDMEICFFLEGIGKAIDDGVEYELKSGDVNVVYSGHSHEIINTGDTDLVYMALVLYMPEEQA